MSPGIAPTMSKKAAKAARREAVASAASGFPTPVPLTKVQALELLKGDLDGELFLELQARLAKPKVVPPEKKEIDLLRKRIEKDKAKDQQAKQDQRVYNLRNDLALAETQAEENRQRVPVLQSEWHALFDQAGEETDEKVEKQHSQGDLESNGMEATDDERIPLGDSDGFLTVLSRSRRKKQRREAELDGQGEKTPDDDPPRHPPVPTDVLDRLDPGVLCQHIIGGVPAEQFEGAMHNLASNFPEAIAGTAFDRGIMDVAAGRKVKMKAKKSSNSLLFPDMKKKSCFNFQSPLSGSTDFNFSILPVPALSELKATAFSAACRERSDVDVSAGLVGQPCAASASRLCRVQSHAVLDTTLTGCGMGQDLRLLRSGGGAAETDFNGALGAAETDLKRAVCVAETDFHGMIPRSRSLSQLRGDAGVVAGEVCLSEDHRQVVDPMPCDVAVLAELEGVCVRRRKAGCSAGVDSDSSRTHVGSGRNSRIHGSQSSSFACARVSSGCLLGACGVGSASAAVGSACLPAVRTRTYADVAASACRGMAVEQRHACNSVVSGGFLGCAEVHQLQLGNGKAGSHVEEGFQNWGFQSSRRFAPCLIGGGRGKFSAGWWFSEAGCRFTSQEATVPGSTGLVLTHLPSTRRFLVSNSCHLDMDWTSGNQWAGRRCVEPHSRGFGC